MEDKALKIYSLILDYGAEKFNEAFDYCNSNKQDSEKAKEKAKEIRDEIWKLLNEDRK